ncbi:MAG: hypothetical protein E3J78_02870 [Candidatus Cloacimonadota bacterium]|nr:MAG: hypothetical protein E3J78_02870 [Candidatus Cloacimonadota bacterium]
MNSKNNSVFPIIHFLLICTVSVSLLGAQEKELSEKHYRIYSRAKKEVTVIEHMVDDCAHYDVIVLGEEHSDSVAHYLEHLLLEKLYNRYGASIALSLEMFERDVQVVLTEYIENKIEKKRFEKDARLWINYKDYQPMVEFSKENGIDIIAANAPFRYAHLANARGQEFLETLSKSSKSFFAPLPCDTASGAYHDKLMNLKNLIPVSPVKDSLLPDGMKNKKMPSLMPTFDIIQGQSLWDATMAHSAYRYLEENQGKKILHINGRMHSDEFFGIVQQLKHYNKKLKILVLSVFPEDSFPNTDFSQYDNLADYIIVTDPSIPKTIKE